MSPFAVFVNQLLGIVDVLVFVVFGLTFVFLAWKIIDAWIINGGDANKASEAKTAVFYGIIVLVVMSSVWGIVALLRTSLFG